MAHFTLLACCLQLKSVAHFSATVFFCTILLSGCQVSAFSLWWRMTCDIPGAKQEIVPNNSIFFVCGTEILFFCTISCLIAGQLSQFILYAKQLITVNRKKSVETVWLQFCSQRSAIKVLVQQPFVVEALKYVSHCCITDSSPFRVKSSCSSKKV